MQIFDIGPLEFILIIIIALVVLGPEQMISSAKKAGIWIRKMIRSPIWTSLMDSSREIRDIQTKIVKETGLDQTLDEIRQSSQMPNLDLKPIQGVDLKLPTLNEIKNAPDPDKPTSETTKTVPTSTSAPEPTSTEVRPASSSSTAAINSITTPAAPAPTDASEDSNPDDHPAEKSPTE